ncbi:MAG: ribose 5-phosphate isomerase B [Lachnospiraceae bacterium]|nr:ribose 5-phosphate isomerase B [Lachnospiraceae bacterium]
MGTTAIGSDHGGFEMKKQLMEHLAKEGYELKDFGCYTAESCDYPDIAKAVAKAVAAGECENGILICGTGIGMAMAAGKVPGIRAALCGDVYSAKLTRSHNDANILTMGARVIGPGLAEMIADTFLSTPFSNEERHVRRLSKLEED